MSYFEGQLSKQKKIEEEIKKREEQSESEDGVSEVCFKTVRVDVLYICFIFLENTCCYSTAMLQ